MLAVDGEPVTSAVEGYRRAAAHSVGELVEYLFAGQGGRETRTFPLRLFTDGEHLAIFGMYLLGGLAYLALAVLASLRPSTSSGPASFARLLGRVSSL